MTLVRWLVYGLVFLAEVAVMVAVVGFVLWGWLQ